MEVLWLEDSIRSSTTGNVRPTRADVVPFNPKFDRSRSPAARSDHRLVWRRHRGTLDSARIAAFHAGSDTVLAYDLREQYRHPQIMAGTDSTEHPSPSVRPEDNLDVQKVFKFIRAIVYTRNPFTICGRHGDRINGIFTVFILDLLTNRAFFIDSDAPVPLTLLLRPRRSARGTVLDWRTKPMLGAAPAQLFYLDDRPTFQADVAFNGLMVTFGACVHP